MTKKDYEFLGVREIKPENSYTQIERGAYDNSYNQTIECDYMFRGKRYNIDWVFTYTKKGVDVRIRYANGGSWRTKKVTWHTRNTDTSSKRREIMEEEIKNTKEYKDFVETVEKMDEENKRKHKKNKPVVKEITEVDIDEKNYYYSTIYFKLKGYGDVVFKIVYDNRSVQVDDTYKGDRLIEDAREKKGFRAYLDWQQELIDQIHQHPSLRVRFVTGKYPKIGSKF